MRIDGRGLLLLACLVAPPLAAAPAFATTLPRGSVSADCSSYTVTFDAEGFDEPGDSITVTMSIVLVAGGETRVETHTETITGSGNFEVSFRYEWVPPLCGSWFFLEGGSDGSRYDWVNNFGLGSAEAIAITTPPDRTLDCACDEPVVEICRTPGFWGTHAGTEKRNSTDITGAVIAAAGGSIEVCGKSLDGTALGSMTSAEEALCVSVKGDRKLQLARHLAAAALNCVMSGGGLDCSGLSVADAFASCNAQCTAPDADLSGCIDRIACFNEGGRLLPNGMCQIGTCSDSGDPCGGDDDCRAGGDRGCDGDGHGDGDAASCVPLPDNCHDRPLVNAELGLFFDPPGPAGSSGKCNDARRNDCSIFTCPGGGSGGGKDGKDGKGGRH